jgi:predicted GNAT family N-acyltransferase
MSRLPPRVREADFTRDYADIRRIRFEVFVHEQRVPEDLEMDDRDRPSVHVLARLGEAAVGTGRIDLEAGGKIGRVAVVAAARGRGIGTEIMRALHRIARRHGLDSVWCHAQLSARTFYSRLGYRPSGDVFDEAGIEHVRMDADLARRAPSVRVPAGSRGRASPEDEGGRS